MQTTPVSSAMLVITHTTLRDTRGLELGIVNPNLDLSSTLDLEGMGGKLQAWKWVYKMRGKDKSKGREKEIESRIGDRDYRWLLLRLCLRSRRFS